MPDWLRLKTMKNNKKKSSEKNWLRRNFILGLKILVTIAFLYYFFNSFEWDKLNSILLNANWTILIFAFIIFAMRLLPIALRWVHISKASGYPIALKDSVHWYYVGGFFNVFLPTGRGGDVIRGIFASKQNEYPIGVTMMIIFLERLIGLITSLFLLFAMTLIAMNKIHHLKEALISSFGLLLLLFAAIYVSFHPIFRRQISKIMNLLNFKKLNTLTHQLFTIMDACWNHPKVIISSAAFSILNQFIFIFSGFLVGMAIKGFDAPWYSYPIVIPLIFLSELLPSVGGYGVREVGFLIFFEWFGVNNDSAAVYGIIQLFFLWGSAVIGGLLFLKGNTTGRMSRADLAKCRQ